MSLTKPIHKVQSGSTVLTKNLEAPARPKAYSGEGMDLVEHKAKAKHIVRIMGEKKRKNARDGKRWELFEGLKIAEVTLGHGSITLSHFREALQDAINHDDWDFIRAISRWHAERKPPAVDPLATFLLKGWERCDHASDNWTGLQQIDDRGIALFAGSLKIKIRRSKGRGDANGQFAVQEKCAMLGLRRTTEPRFTFRIVAGQIVLRKLAQ